MDGEFIDNAYKMGAGRYLQEPHALSLLGEEVRLLGTKAFVLGGPHSLPLVKDKVEASLDGASIPFEMQAYAMPPIRAEVRKMADHAREQACDVVIGIGGGRMMDAAKAVACSAKAPLVQVPTSVATCAAYSPLSVMYTPEGAHDGTWRFTHEVDAVVVDMDVMANQPPRLIAAGVLDAMAKVYEIENGGVGIDCSTESIQRYAAYQYARINLDVLTRFGKQAYDEATSLQSADGRESGRSVQADVTQAVAECELGALERVAFANIALTGIVSSLTRGFHQTALAHKLYDGMRTFFASESKPWLHGEIVAIGLLMQLVYNGDADRVPQLREFMQSMNMPCSLGELSVSADDPRYKALYDYVAFSEFVSEGARGNGTVAAAFAEITN